MPNAPGKAVSAASGLRVGGFVLELLHELLPSCISHVALLFFAPPTHVALLFLPPAPEPDCFNLNLIQNQRPAQL
jgi:hypothetical protein